MSAPEFSKMKASQQSQRITKILPQSSLAPAPLGLTRTETQRLTMGVRPASELGSCPHSRRGVGLSNVHGHVTKPAGLKAAWPGLFHPTAGPGEGAWSPTWAAPRCRGRLLCSRALSGSGVKTPREKVAQFQP